MRPTGQPYVKGPSSNPPSREELIKLVKIHGQVDEKYQTKETVDYTFLVLILMFVILLMIIFWKIRKKKH